MLNENIIRDYSVDIYMSELNRTINSRSVFNQKDNKTAVLVVRLFNNKKEKLAVNLENTTVIAKILKSDNTTSTIQCSIIDEVKGIVAIGFTQQALIVVGDHQLELLLQCGEQLSYSPKIIYTVKDNLFDESNEIESQTEFPILAGLINTVQSLGDRTEQLDSLVTDNEEIRSSNESARITNEDSRRTNEDDRIKTFEELAKTFGDMNTDISNKLNDINTTIGNAEDLITKVDTDFSNIKSEFDDINDTFKNYTKLIDDQLIKMESLHEQVSSDELVRQKNESDRTNTFNNMISSLDVSDSDITDIIDMVGGGL